MDCGALICPWHGLRLDGGREFGWKPLPAYDDGVLVWVRLDKVGGRNRWTSRSCRRADRAATGRRRTPGGASASPDIISNRLDPWHGAWFHPYSFAQLEVLSAPPLDADEDSDTFQVAVTFPWGGWACR